MERHRQRRGMITGRADRQQGCDGNRNSPAITQQPCARPNRRSGVNRVISDGHSPPADSLPRTAAQASRYSVAAAASGSGAGAR